MPHLVDLLLLLILLAVASVGWRRGFLRGAVDLLRWIGSLAIGLATYRFLDHLLMLTGWEGGWRRATAFALAILISGTLLRILASRLLAEVPEEGHRSRLNRLLGLIPGAINGTIIAAVVAALLLALPTPLLENARESPTANLFARWVMEGERLFEAPLGEALNRVSVGPAEEARLELPFRVTDAPPRPDLERRMLGLLNRERRERGLDTLRADTLFRAIARRHAADMLARSYFSHLNPEGKTPFDRIRAGGGRFLIAGENLALAPTIPVAHQGLMDSPGHRANILRPQFGHVGIGVLDAGARGLMVVQVFRE